MGAARWMTCLWPGLAPLWLRGRWSGFFVAALFAVVLNGALAATLLDATPVGPGGRFALWTVAVAWWLHSLWRGPTALREPVAAASEGLFQEAQTEYLRGHWFEAETRLRRLLAQREEDVEARLLLATLYRRTGRSAPAAQELARAARADQRGAWALELAREKELLAADAASERPAEPPTAAQAA